MINNNDVYQTLKKLTLEEFVKILSTYEDIKINDANLDKDPIKEKKIFYTTDELINKYPFFTRYNINKAIEKNKLPYFTIGNKRMFNKDEIEKWLDKESKSKKEKIKYDI